MSSTPLRLRRLPLEAVKNLEIGLSNPLTRRATLSRVAGEGINHLNRVNSLAPISGEMGGGLGSLHKDS